MTRLLSSDRRWNVTTPAFRGPVMLCHAIRASGICSEISAFQAMSLPPTSAFQSRGGPSRRPAPRPLPTPPARPAVPPPPAGGLPVEGALVELPHLPHPVHEARELLELRPL